MKFEVTDLLPLKRLLYNSKILKISIPIFIITIEKRKKKKKVEGKRAKLQRVIINYSSQNYLGIINLLLFTTYSLTDTILIFIAVGVLLQQSTNIPF